MAKVKLTQKQADEIERIKRIGFPGHWKEDGWFIERDEKINDLSFHQLTNAVFNGYEVEPEFKVGDWVVHEPMNRTRIISSLTKGNHDTYAGFDNDLIQGVSVEWIRHATPQEIAEEKERRWWAKHDRDVWEIREGDVLEYLGDPLIIDWFDSEDVRFKSGECNPGFMENFDYVKEYFKVFCFVEDRKDA